MKQHQLEYTEQPNFLNLCVEIQTTLTVLQLLECCLKTEECLHRIRKERWGPRTLDVDILLYGERNDRFTKTVGATSE